MSKKTQIAKLIRAMKGDELMTMANDFVEMQSNAEDDGSGFNLESHASVSRMLRSWAKGLGSME